MPLQKIVYSGFFIAVGVVLPLVFHAVGLGSIFLPMHIPVLLAGFILGPCCGMLTGIISPLISSLLTGMPPVSPPILPIMAIELAVYGAMTGFVYNKSGGVYAALVCAMIAGRLAAGFGVYLAGRLCGFNVPVVVYLSGAVIKGVPGILLQLVSIPVLLKGWRKYRGRRGVGGFGT